MPVNVAPLIIMTLCVGAAVVAGLLAFVSRRLCVAALILATVAFLAFLALYFVPIWVKAASASTADDFFNVGVAYRERAAHTFPNRSAATHWFERAAQAGHRQGQFECGLAYLNGWGVKKDRVIARKWFEAAASAGDRNAAEYLARMGNN